MKYVTDGSTVQYHESGVVLIILGLIPFSQLVRVQDYSLFGGEFDLSLCGGIYPHPVLKVASTYPP